MRNSERNRAKNHAGRHSARRKRRLHGVMRMGVAVAGAGSWSRGATTLDVGRRQQRKLGYQRHQYRLEHPAAPHGRMAIRRSSMGAEVRSLWTATSPQPESDSRLMAIQSVGAATLTLRNGEAAPAALPT